MILTGRTWWQPQKGKKEEHQMVLPEFIDALVLLSIHLYVHSGGAAKSGGSDECHWLGMTYWQLGCQA